MADELDGPLMDGAAATQGAVRALRSGELVLDGGRDEETLAALRAHVAAVAELDGRLEGIRRALVRAHQRAGGSVGELAAALGVPRSTAQGQLAAVRSSSPGGWERWAAGEAAEAVSSMSPADLRPGDTLVGTSDRDGLHEQVQAVHVWEDGYVEVVSGGVAAAYCFAGGETVLAVHRGNASLYTSGVHIDQEGREHTAHERHPAQHRR